MSENYEAAKAEITRIAAKYGWAVEILRSPAFKLLDEDRIGFVEEHGSRDRPLRKRRRRKP